MVKFAKNQLILEFHQTIFARQSAPWSYSYILKLWTFDSWIVEKTGWVSLVFSQKPQLKMWSESRFRNYGSMCLKWAMNLSWCYAHDRSKHRFLSVLLSDPC